MEDIQATADSIATAISELERRCRSLTGSACI